MTPPAFIDFFAPSVEVAQALIGSTLLVDGVGGRIVETAAYDHDDADTNTSTDPTTRTMVTIGPPGRAYIYRSDGIHWCQNFVCQTEGHGEGVLPREIEPVAGLEIMNARS